MLFAPGKFHTCRVIGVILTAIFSLGLTGLGYLLMRGWLSEFDPRARFGISGIVGMGVMGMLTFLLGFFPGGFKWGAAVVGLVAAIGLFSLVSRRAELKLFGRKPEGVDLIYIVVPILMALFPLVGVLAPSTAQDWDSIAYHLAVPKLWLEAGQRTEITFIHHSNFPFTLDNLFVWGLTWGGQAGAKAFMLMGYIFGALIMYGLGRMRGSSTTGIVAAIAFCSVPSVLWESGTAYIDVVHGLYAGVGAWLVLGPDRLKKGAPLVGAILLGLAAGSKYTGLQTLFAVAVALPFAVGDSIGQRAKQGVLIGLIAVLVAAPWYVRNAVAVGNPVYPFFYEKLGGKNWDQNQADVYRNEQKTFGVPLDGALSPAHAALGLAYQPGRYTNPNPKLQQTPGGWSGGLGDPLGATGFIIILGFLLGLANMRVRRTVSPVIFVGLSLLLWLALSQQSRYLLSLAPILALVFAIEASADGMLKRPLTGALAAQVTLSIYILQTFWLTPPRVAAATGGMTETEYTQRFVPLARAAQAIDKMDEVKKVALYDEVFGYYLNKPYYWASYGHSTEMGYAGIDSPDKLMEAWERMGFTHVYVNLAMSDPSFVRDQWTPAMGLGLSETGWQTLPPIPLPADVHKGLAADVQVRWKPFLADLVARGDLQLVPQPNSRALFFRILGQ